MEIERELTTDAGNAYEKFLADDAVVVVPGMVLDKQSTIEAMKQSPGWSSFEADDPQLLDLGDGAALVTYTFSGHRDPDTDYNAVLTSVYSKGDGGWRMRFHQQTPLEDG